MREKNSSIFRTQKLTLADLPFLREAGRVEGENFILDHNFRGSSLRTGPFIIPVKKLLEAEHAGLVEYIFRALVPQRPALLPWVFSNKSLIKLADYLLRFKSGSPLTFYHYVHLIRYFATWVGQEPDTILEDIRGNNGYPDPVKMHSHQKALRDYVAHLQDRGLAPNRVANYVKAVKSLYRTAEIRLELPYSLPRRVINHDRAPTERELSALMDAADLREKVIVSLLALGGFRVGTLAKLKYRHVRRDLEAGKPIVQIHVEAGITKGKYHDYDTFIGGEAVRYLRLYLKARREGTLGRYTPPENLDDESPLIRDDSFKVARPIGEKQISHLVSALIKKAGLVKPGDPYKLRVHSIRKFFKTQLLARRVQPDYVDYMMGHTIDTYHDVKSRLEDLHMEYARANLTLEPKPVLSKVDQLKVFAQGLGLDPDRIISAEAFSEPHRAIAESEEDQVSILSRAIKDHLKDEIIRELSPASNTVPMLYGDGAAGI